MKWLGDHTGAEDLSNLLRGRHIRSAQIDPADPHDAVFVLDDGTRLRLAGNYGGCNCGAGDYYATAVGGMSWTIMSVDVLDQPGDGDEGHIYSVFAYGEHPALKCEMARIEGDDGNGYYGTGFRFAIHAPTLNQQIGER